MLSSTLKYSSSSHSWNTNPTCRTRNTRRSLSDMDWMDEPAVMTVPLAGAIIPAMRLRSVVLPEPLGPMNATVSPAPTPRSALPPGSDPSGGLSPAGGQASLPPLNLKFIGSVGNAEGVKVAVLLTDRNEVLTGQSGEVVANRYRIARIGIESVDLEDVGTGQSRRIPLKGN